MGARERLTEVEEGALAAGDDREVLAQDKVIDVFLGPQVITEFFSPETSARFRRETDGRVQGCGLLQSPLERLKTL
jgi:hypothetical protein